MVFHKRKRFFHSKRKKKNSVVKIVKREILRMAENKYHDFTITANMVQTFNIQDTLMIAQSAGASTDVTRIGDNIQVTSLHIRYNVIASSTATSAHNCRVLLIQWLEDTVPVAANILTNTGPGVACISDYNMDEFRKNGILKILFDKSHSVSASIGGPAITHHVNKHIKRFRHNLNFSTGGTTPNNGDIYLVFMSDTSTAAEVPVLSYYQRVQWTDM